LVLTVFLKCHFYVDRALPPADDRG